MLRKYLESAVPDKKSDYRELSFLVLDLETTGLDPARDAVVAAGWVLIERGRVHLQTAFQTVINAETEVAQSARIHGIVDSRLKDGVLPHVFFDRLLTDLEGRVLVCHCAPIEFGFLSAMAHNIYGCGLHIPVVDTMKIEMRRFNQQNKMVGEGDLRLPMMRRRYGLPDMHSHQALNDALATAELFLAMTAQMAGRGRLPLKLLL
ncbi:MAG: exonuclease domain-containing protein [Ardenticatenaceae bacterium]|nr:exonuclease domain-containing protein [Ardenticatenaceae bacterium]